MRARIIRCLLLAVAIAAATCAPASASDYPDRPIRFIVGFGAGGPTDIVARVLADQIGGVLGKRVVVENRTGAAGNIATQAVAGAPADGYAFLVGASPLAVNQTLYPDLPVKFGKDLIAIAPIGATSNVLVVNPALNVRNLADFVRVVRERPGKISYATLGRGSSSHLAGVAFDMLAGTSMVPVAYRGGGDAAKDLLGGHVDAWFATIPSVLDAIRAGNLVALGTTGPERASWLPEVPTIAEAGYPGFDVRLWVGIFAPAGVPEERLAVVTRAVAHAMVSPEMRRSLDSQGVAPFRMDRAQFNAFVLNEIERWKGVLARLTN